MAMNAYDEMYGPEPKGWYGEVADDSHLFHDLTGTAHCEYCEYTYGHDIDCFRHRGNPDYERK